MIKNKVLVFGLIMLDEMKVDVRNIIDCYIDFKFFEYWMLEKVQRLRKLIKDFENVVFDVDLLYICLK